MVVLYEYECKKNIGRALEEVEKGDINSDRVQETFEKVYWKSSDLIVHILVNIRQIYDENEAIIDKYYKNTVAPALQKEYSYKNVMEIPKLDKIVVCMGLGAVKDNSKSFNIAVDELAAISGQKPVITKAKKSIASQKITKE